MKILRDYQQRIVDKVLASEKDVLICLPTGSGKTVIGFSIIQKLNNKGFYVVFIVPRLELIKQANKEFGEVDFIWSDKTKLTGKKCIIASKDSLRTQYKKLPANCVLIFDEAHISLEQTKKLVDLIKPVRILGLTATPERMDGKALLKGSDTIHKFGCFDELLQEETVVSLIDKGFLCPLKYYTKPIDGITDIKPEDANGQELSDKQMTEIFDNNQIWGDIVESYEKYGIQKGIKRPALGFTNTISMAEKVCDIFNNAGYRFKVISGEMNIKKREELISQLKTSSIDGLVNAALLTYGFDCPPVSYAFSCRHIKSRPLWFQIIGRILRTFEGKENAIFVDHGDSISEFEEPTCSLPILDPYITWKVNGETKIERQKRKKVQKKERDSLKLLQELDPLPCNMVEIKPENTWERMINVLQRLRNENEGLFKLTENLKNHAENVTKENEKLKESLKRNEAKRFVDSQKTFEFVKKYYCFERNRIHESFEKDLYRQRTVLTYEKKSELEHQKTVQKLYALEVKQSFLFDDATFIRGINYWKTHYRYIQNMYR